MTVDSRSFRKVMACFASGVTVVTTVTGDGHAVGVTISSFASLSLEPPLVLICLDQQMLDLQAFTTGSFAVNILKENQRDLSVQFATRNSKKWSGAIYETWETGVPILTGCLANIECDVEKIHDGGDHRIITGRVRKLSSCQDGHPLIYFRSTYLGLAKA
ncbi:Nitrilotriacetate monooxygenase component B [invertebrate metagenome]|uniref:Nitrilotriacetate monooxygenase component B n=1 Tax=invertebrate metagenome TaxID=1711999 RepID=A0A484H6C8_9ZZZZ